MAVSTNLQPFQQIYSRFKPFTAVLSAPAEESDNSLSCQKNETVWTVEGYLRSLKLWLTSQLV